jgi:hypothetical protein
MKWVPVEAEILFIRVLESRQKLSNQLYKRSIAFHPLIGSASSIGKVKNRETAGLCRARGVLRGRGGFEGMRIRVKEERGVTY